MRIEKIRSDQFYISWAIRILQNHVHLLINELIKYKLLKEPKRLNLIMLNLFSLRPSLPLVNNIERFKLLQKNQALQFDPSYL